MAFLAMLTRLKSEQALLVDNLAFGFGRHRSMVELTLKHVDGIRWIDLGCVQSTLIKHHRNRTSSD